LRKSTLRKNRRVADFNLRRSFYQHLPLTCDAAVPAPAFNQRRSCTSTCL
ncbi:hypothetical protein BgiMline_028782, partial [Biomphalaria glabrata]